MGLHRIRIALLVLIASLIWVQPVQATSRWDVLQWCSAANQLDVARCEGFLNAAIDLRTSDDFSGSKSCFMASTRLSQVREEVVGWLKVNKVAPEQSGLALVARAIKERFPCSKS